MDCFENYDDKIFEFQNYRRAIILEESIFKNEIKSVFLNENLM